MKKNVWALLLVITMFVTTVSFPTVAAAEGEKDDSGVIIEVKNDVNGSDTEEPGGMQAVQISAQNQGDKDAVMRISLLNEDKETADTEVEIPNLCEKDRITDETVQNDMTKTLESALTLSDGRNASLDAQWVEKKDDNGAVTARYLEAALPAGAATAFDMQLMYRTDEENYTKKTIVQAKAFVDEQDVTEASDVEDEDNEAEVDWETVTDPAESEDNEAEVNGETVTDPAESEAEEDSANTVLYSGASDKSNEDTLIIYFTPSDEWITNGYTFQVQLKKQTEADNWTGLRDLTDSGETVDGKKVYFAEFTVGENDTTKDLPYRGTARVQFQYFENGNYKGELNPISTWTSSDLLNGKYFDANKPDDGFVEFKPDETAGTELGFIDMTQRLPEGSVTVEFFTDSDHSSESEQVNGTFCVPENYNGTEKYTKVRLTINGAQTEQFSLKDLIKNGTTYYCYGETELPDGDLISGWQTPVSGSDSIAGRTLYFSSSDFSVNDIICIGDKQGTLSERDEDSVKTLFYKIPDDLEATQDTIITIVHENENTTYHFLWKDFAKNKVTVSSRVAEVSDVQSVERIVYFDATLSKLYYGISKTAANGNADTSETPNGKESGRAIPATENGNVYFWMRKDQSDSGQKGTMEKVDANLYRCTAPAEYTEITFAAYDYNTPNAGIAWNGSGTDWLKIPAPAIEEPCFYADSGDPVTYYLKN